MAIYKKLQADICNNSGLANSCPINFESNKKEKLTVGDKDWIDFKKGYVYFIAEAISYSERNEIYNTKYNNEVYCTKNKDYYVRYVKIGWTNNKPNKRLKALQTSTPRNLFILGSIYTHREAEAMIHKVLDHGRVKGEWFDLNIIGEQLAMWVPIWDYYDLDNNILNMNKYVFKDKTLKEKKLFELSNEFNDILQHYPKNIYFPKIGSLLKPTMARKMHFDFIGNMINIGDKYYQIQNSGTFGDVTKISESTLLMFFELCKKFNFIDSMKIILDMNN